MDVKKREYPCKVIGSPNCRQIVTNLIDFALDSEYFLVIALIILRYAYRLKQIDNGGAFKYFSETEVTFSAPSSYALKQNYPNSFNPSTVISYVLPWAGMVTLKIYNLFGQEVMTLVNETKEVGSHKAQFNASQFASGVYFFELTAEKFSSIRKRTLLKKSEL